MVSYNKQRFFLGVFFFLAGFNFATWASRIPTIKSFYSFNDAELGTLLLVLPISSLLGLPISGWIISRFNSSIPLAVGFGLNALSLILIGFSNSILSLSISIFIFAFTMRIFSVSCNSQSIVLQKLYTKPIIGSFHGLWSAGGIAGILFTTIILKLNVGMLSHLLWVGSTTTVMCIFSYQFLIKGDKPTEGNKLIIGKPDPYILYLGLLAFFAAVCEGGMFDWSGIYFKEVLQVPIFTYGYLIFMTFMAATRFLSDKIIAKIGMKMTYLFSSLSIVIGILIAIVIPNFWFGLLGFSLVGIGTASVVPMTYSLAGYSKKYSPGMAISIVATYFILGILVGPAIIGYLSHAFNLRSSFLFFVVCGLMLIPISQLFFKYQKQIN
jgi:MFS family permease